MILSHKYKFIFVKTAKVAGTSLEIALRPFLGPEDIATPVVWHDEEWAKKHGMPGPQNFSKSYDLLTKTFGARGIFHEHSWAYEIKGIVGEKIWKEYLTFTLEREPHEKGMSTYFHARHRLYTPEWLGPFVRTLRFYISALRKREIARVPSLSIAKFISLSAWMELESFYAFSQNFLRYTVNDEVIVKRVYAYRSLSLLRDHLEERIGHKLVLPKLKGEFRKRKMTQEEQGRFMRLLRTNEIYDKEYELTEKIQDSGTGYYSRGEREE